MSGDALVPTVTTSSRGGGLFAYNCATKVLEYLIMHNVAGATGAFIGNGVKDEAGTPLFSLSNSQSPIFGSVLLSLQEELFLYTRGLFVLVASATSPSGEIRGQISEEYDWWAYLTGSGVVPSVSTSAVGLATMQLKGNANRALDYAIFHNVEFPLRATMNVAYEGNNGQSNFAFKNVFSPIRGNDFLMDDDDLQAFTTDASYISITSSDYPFLGEIRGQIHRINPCVPDNDNVLTVSSVRNNRNKKDVMHLEVPSSLGEDLIASTVNERNSGSLLQLSVAALVLVAFLF